MAAAFRRGEPGPAAGGVMRPLARMLVVARSWFWPHHVDREFHEELTFHVEREADAFQQSGMTPAAAKRAARLSVGAVTVLEEESRDARPGAALRRLWRDVRFASRQLLRDRWYTAGVVVTLALSIGATTAIYSALRVVLFNPLPIPAANRVVIGWETLPERGLPLAELPFRYIERVGTHAKSLSASAGVGASSWPTILDLDNEPTRISVTGVTASFFATLGVRPLRGTVFGAEDDVPHAAATSVLSYPLWQSRFGGDLNVLGRVVQLDGKPSRVIGVMPQGFDYPPGTDAWIPVVSALVGDGDDSDLALGTVGVLLLVGRLRDGVTIEAARADLEPLEDGLGPNGGRMGSSLALMPVVEQVLGPVRPALWALLLAVSILLAIACANVSALMLTRIARHQREHGIRLALGSSRAAVGRLWMTQSLLLSLSGGALGLLLARWMIAAIVASAPPHIPRLGAVTINLPAAAIALAVTVVVTLACGALPVREAALTNLAHAIAGSGRTTADRHSRRLRGWLLAGQAALTIVLLIGAALVVRSFMNLRRVDFGFRPAGVVALHVETRSRPATNQWISELLERVSRRGDVEAAGAVALRPLGLGAIGDERAIALEGQSNTEQDTQKNPLVNYQVATPGYFGAMRIPLIEGRLFSADDTAHSPRVVVVGQSAARRLWPHERAIGQRFLIANHSPDPARAWRTVIGVVADVRYRGLDDVRLDVYDLAAQSDHVADDLMIRSHGNLAAVAADVLAEARRLDPRVVVDDITTMDAIVSRAMAPWRFSVWIFVSFALLALLLAAVGLFGAVSLDGASRRREFAVHLAVGATPATLVRGMLRRSTVQVLPGIAAGFALSAFVYRVLSGLLFEVPAIGATTLLGVGVLILAVIAIAAICPALSVAYAPPARTLTVE